MTTQTTLFPEPTATLELLGLRTAELQLSLDASAMQRVAAQWQRLEAMAKLISAQSLGADDEPAMTYTP